MTTKTAVRYGNLSRNARDTIKFWYGNPVTIAGYIRFWFGPERVADGEVVTWRGDSCGCPDDRCIGFHHDRPDDCHCLPVTVGEYAAFVVNGKRPAWMADA